MNRQKYLQKRIQDILDSYVKKHNKIPKFEIIGAYCVSEVKEEEVLR